ncbi:MAG TPA: hypothetical protein QF646_01045, partial [Candidatus Poseidoniales archaeon]|nr:hypothetical protein [Candidatus Poseidoniales archaeon]
DRFGFSSVKSKGIQSFMYSDGLVLTDLQIIEYNDVDEIDVRDTWIYTSTQLNISGRYVYLNGQGDVTEALPEAPLTLGLYREGAERPNDRPWDAALAEIQCWTFTGGVFDITFQAPIRTQRYVYHVDLVEDNQERCEDSQQSPALDNRDFTPAGERLFNLYTDNDAPSLSVNDQGQSIFNVNGLTKSDPSTIPISRIECFEYSVFIFDSEHPGPDFLPDSTPYLLKWVYYDPETKDFWSEAKETSSQPKVFSESLKEFGITTNSYKFESKAEGGSCIDLWPLNRPVPSTVTDVQIRMWIEGEDSAGNELAGGGSYQTPLIEMFVESLEARFEIILGSVPAIEGGETNTVSVDESFSVYFQFNNIGTVSGAFDYTLYLVDEDELIP